MDEDRWEVVKPYLAEKEDQLPDRKGLGGEALGENIRWPGRASGNVSHLTGKARSPRITSVWPHGPSTRRRSCKLWASDLQALGDPQVGDSPSGKCRLGFCCQARSVESTSRANPSDRDDLHATTRSFLSRRLYDPYGERTQNHALRRKPLCHPRSKKVFDRSAERFGIGLAVPPERCLTHLFHPSREWNSDRDRTQFRAAWTLATAGRRRTNAWDCLPPGFR